MTGHGLYPGILLLESESTQNTSTKPSAKNGSLASSFSLISRDLGAKRYMSRKRLEEIQKEANNLVAG